MSRSQPLPSKLHSQRSCEVCEVCENRGTLFQIRRYSLISLLRSSWTVSAPKVHSYISAHDAGTVDNGGKRDAGKRPTHQLAPILPGQNTWMWARSSIDCTNPEVFPPKFLPRNKRTDRPRRRCFNPRTGAAVAMCQPFSGVASRSIYPLSGRTGWNRTM